MVFIHVKKTIKIICLTCICFFSFETQAFLNGANAIDLIGQYTQNDGVTPDYVGSSQNDVPGMYGLNHPSGNALDAINHRLFISDSDNNRVLVFNLNVSNQLVDRTPDYVLGQASFVTKTVSTTQSGMNTPSGLAYDSVNNRLFVADSSSNRVLVYDVASITNGENAVAVLGQIDFVNSSAATTQAGMSNPTRLAYDTVNQRVFVVDNSNSRVTAYNATSTIINGANAVAVLGQTNFTSSGSDTTQSTMSYPVDIAYDNTNQRLFVADSNNNRVIVYNATSTIINGANAINVLGQTNFTNFGFAATQAGMALPSGLTYDSLNQRLFVSDSGNNRVTVYNATSTMINGASATKVLGQTNFTNYSAATTQSRMDEPLSLSYDTVSQQLFLADRGNNRVTVYNATSTIINGSNAIDLIGQYTQNDGVTPSYTTGNADDNPYLYGLYNPRGSVIDSVNHRLFAVDDGNNRVLVFNLNASNQLVDRTPDYVLGQSNFSESLHGATSALIHWPTGVAYDNVNNRLFLVDSGNNRVLIYDVTSITNGESAVAVLGQTNFTNTSALITQAGMYLPDSIAYDSVNQRLFVTQAAANRVTVYNATSTIINGASAVAVLGQVNFTNSGFAATQAGVNYPTDVVYDGLNQRLFVSDGGNNRVTVYNATSTIINGAGAVAVLGQINFTSTAAATTQSGMSTPSGLAYDGVNQRLFVADGSNNRVTVYNATSTIINGASAVAVLGQANFVSSLGTTTQSGMNRPIDLMYDDTNQRLFVSDNDNSRFTIFNVTPLSVELSAVASASADETVADNFPKLLVTGASATTSTIQLDITGGTATAVTDFSSADPINITIPPGVYDGTLSTAITITPPTLVQDSLEESGGETLILSLINPSNVMVEDVNSDLTVQSLSTYTITDSPVVRSATVPAVIGPIGGSAPVSVSVIRNSASTKALPQVFTRTLKLNSKGVDVKDLQKFLNSQGFSVAKKGPGSKGKETTLFGPATKAAVIRFQKAYRITPANGVVGEKTRGKVEEVLKK